MKKKILSRAIGAIVPIVVLAVLAVVPYSFGLQAEKRYDRMMQEWAQHSGATIKTVSYERGWLTSNASMTVAMPTLPVVFTVQHHITHGPLPIARWLEGQLDFTPMQAVIDSTASAQAVGNLQLPPLHAVTTVDLDGQIRSRLDVPAVHTTLAGGAKLDFAGLDGTVALADEKPGVRLRLNAPSLVVGSASDGLDLRGVSFTSDTQDGAAGYPVGTTGFVIDKITLPKTKTVVEGVRLTVTTRTQGPNVTLNVDQAVRAATFNGANYGPLQVTFELRKLDAALMMKLSKLGNEVQKQKLPAAQAGMVTTGEALKLIGALAKKTPELEVTKLSLKMPDGEITGHAKLVLDGSQVDIAQNPFALMMALNGDGNLALPAPVVEGWVRTGLQHEVETLKTSGALNADEAARLTDQKVKLIVDQALPGRLQQVLQRYPLVHNGANYEIKLALRGGQVLVNDRPWSMPAKTPATP